MTAKKRLLFFILMSIVILVTAIFVTGQRQLLLQFYLPALWCVYLYIVIVNWLKANINMIWVYIVYLLLLFSTYIFVDDAFIDEMVAFFFMLTIVIDIIYRLLKLFQAKVLKKIKYSYRYLLFTLMPCLLLFIIVQIRDYDMGKIEVRLNSLVKAQIDKCNKDSCYKRLNITQGSTTLSLMAIVFDDCLGLSSHFSVIGLRPVKKCIDADGQVITK